MNLKGSLLNQKGDLFYLKANRYELKANPQEQITNHYELKATLTLEKIKSPFDRLNLQKED